MATKARKQEIVSELHQFFDNGKVAVVADVSGLTVAELTQLRRKLDKDNAKCRVAKNTLVKIATNSKEFEAIKSLAKGPSAIIIGYDDPAQPAKTTVDFFKALKKGTIRGGVLEGKSMTVEEVKGLAELPSKEVLLSGIMGGLDSGARGIAGLLESIIRDIALLAEEVAKKNDTGAPAPAAKVEAAAEEAPKAAAEAAPEAAAEAAPAAEAAAPEAAAEAAPAAEAAAPEAAAEAAPETPEA
ncbi:MAG: 50S ribosomal protein L10 [Candidatus Melainabacteria bacterium]|nr:50S ribosomal protein L10 [Candidatus Melainabacteria bacterium]